MDGNQEFGRPERVPAFNVPVIVTILLIICIVCYAIKYFLPLPLYYSLLQYLVFVPSASFSSGDPLTAFSVLGYSFMHGSWAHLFVNMAWLLVFGSPLANRIGWQRFLVFWIVSAIVSVSPYIFIPHSSSISVVGASGVISAMMGAAGRYGFERVTNFAYNNRPEFAGPVMTMQKALRSERVVLLIGFWLLADIITALMGNTEIAWEVHIAGLIFGFIAIRFFDPRPDSVL